MTITPVDLRNQKFEHRFRGYDPFYVDTIIAEAATEIEKLISANTELQRQIRTLEERVAGYRNIEQSLQDTLVTAQQAAEEKRKSSEREAEIRVQETDLECARLRTKYANDIEQLKLEIASLRMQKVRFMAEVKSLIDTHLKMLDDRQKTEQEEPVEHETTL